MRYGEPLILNHQYATTPMLRYRITAALVALYLIVSPPVSFGQDATPDNEPILVAPGMTEGAWIAPDILSPGATDRPFVAGKQASLSDLSFIWPMPGVVDHDHILVGYMDHDPTSGIRDYTGYIHTYNGHNGVDLGLLNFREMDEGVPVFAAESGVVSATSFVYPDRNTAWAPELSNLMNGVVIDHGSNIESAYFHFRRNSLTVEPGEEVEAGQLLGFAGSSGFSDLPHLHLEVRNTETRTFIDPFEGTAHEGPSLWEDQPRYMGQDELKVYDIGVATVASMGGNADAFDWALFLERLSAPAVFGADEANLVVWFQTQNEARAPYRFEIYKPDGTAFRGFNATLGNRARYAIWYYYFTFGSVVTPADYGTWTIRMLGSDDSQELTRTLFERSFEVGAETEWAPRFLPAGKSIRIDGEVQRDTLRMDQFTGDVTFHGIDQPSYVTVEQDSIVVFQGQSDQESRSAYFQIIATDQHARTDTMWYHTVDPTKPLDAIQTSTVRRGDLPEQIHLSKNYPNPFSGSTNIEFDLATGSHVLLEVFDVLGRKVATVVDEGLPSGRHQVEWNSGDVPNGMYLYRLTSGGYRATQSMMVIR